MAEPSNEISVNINSSVPIFSIELPSGLPGPKGGQGPQGEEGPQGATGPQGAQGPQGVAGPEGARGPQGEQGARGVEGPRGPQGLKGATGATGPQGPQGPQGLTGPQGEIGPKGEQGPQGEIGPKGEQGPQGEIGPKGEQGPQGEVSLETIAASLPSNLLVYGASWDNGPSPVLSRTNGAVDADFDTLPIFRDMKEVQDDYGNEFVRIPKCYIRKTSTDTLTSWEISPFRMDGFYLPACFYDFENKEELPFVDFGKYLASLSSDGKRLESKRDKVPLVSRNISQFRTLAQANGEGYQQLDIHSYDLLRVLMTVEFGTLHMQSVFPGFTSGQWSSDDTVLEDATDTNSFKVSSTTAGRYRTGQSVGIGTSTGGGQRLSSAVVTDIDSDGFITVEGPPFSVLAGDVVYNMAFKTGYSLSQSGLSGGAKDGLSPCWYRGIENPYGDSWQFVDGLNVKDWQSWVADDAQDYTSDKFESPYRPLSYVNRKTDGYVAHIGYDPDNPFATIPNEIDEELLLVSPEEHEALGLSGKSEIGEMAMSRSTIKEGGGTLFGDNAKFETMAAASGSSSTYYADYYYQNAGNRIALVGGHRSNGSFAGPWYWSLSTGSSNAWAYIGGRLLKKPL